MAASPKSWSTVKIKKEDFDQLTQFCRESGQSVQFHVLNAMSKYMTDEFPVWKSRLKKVQAEISKN